MRSSHPQVKRVKSSSVNPITCFPFSVDGIYFVSSSFVSQITVLVTVSVFCPNRMVLQLNFVDLLRHVWSNLPFSFYTSGHLLNSYTSISRIDISNIIVTS